MNNNKTEFYLSILIIILITILLYNNVYKPNGLNNTDLNNTDLNNTDLNNTDLNNTDLNNTIIKDYMLRVNGTKIVDYNGTEITLFGLVIPHQSQIKKINSTDRISHINESWITEKNISYLKNNSINLLDFSEITLDQIIDNTGKLNEPFLETYLDIWIRWCTINKMYTIINLDGFSVNRPEDYGSYSMPEWLYDEYGGVPFNSIDQARVVHDFWDINVTTMDDERELYYKAWSHIANRYKQNPYVMYSIVNEPLHHTYLYANETKLKVLGIGYNNIITNTVDHIRSQGSNQIIFIEIPYLYDDDYNWTKYMIPINRTNIVYEGHSYVSIYGSIIDWYDSIDYFIDVIKLKIGKPFYLGEWWLDPVSYKNELNDWTNITRNQREYLMEKNISSAFFSWGRLYGYYNWAVSGTDEYLTIHEISEIEQIIYR